VDEALKTRGNIYVNAENSLLFAHLSKDSGYVPAGHTPLSIISLTKLTGDLL